MNFQLFDIDAPAEENIGNVLAYLDVAQAEAKAICERHREDIKDGDPPIPVLTAVASGVAPAWAMDTLRRRVA